jgi:hypothetical protein
MNVYELDEYTLRLLYEDVTDASRIARAADFLHKSDAVRQINRNRPARHPALVFPMWMVYTTRTRRNPSRTQN